jgi:Ca2+-transporting ATPase
MTTTPRSPDNRERTPQPPAAAPKSGLASGAARETDGAIAAHAEPIDGLLARLKTDPRTGLTQSEAKTRLERDGRNELPPPTPPSAWKRLISQFANPIVLTLLVAAMIALVEGWSRAGESPLARFGDAIAIFLIVGLNAVLGFYQERQAEAALEALQKMQTPNARVRREDKVVVMPAAELVVGDVLELEAGDAVPADARVTHSIDLASEESALTGESVPVGKDAKAYVPDDAPLGDRSTMIFVGTNVVRGKGRAVVVATAVRTELGKLSELMRQAEGGRTPLEEKLESFGKKILWACLLLSALLFVRGFIKGDRPWTVLLLEAVSLAVAAIPEGLPAITTITLALGMQRMAKRGAIIRKLAAVETLGAATVICSDKTGTLTQNEMTVREIYSGGTCYKVTGVGYDPRGELQQMSGQAVGSPDKPLRHLLEIVALCNNASLDLDDDGRWKAIGDPTEAALLTLAAKGGLPRESLTPGHQLLKEVPFDSDRKRMTILTLDAKGREVVHTKGSAEILLPLCSHLETESGIVALDDKQRARITAEVERMSGASLRVLAVARRVLRSQAQRASMPEISAEEHEIERDLTFVGLAGMIDPPRDGVKEAVQACADAHVTAVMITGDHKLTAIAIATELGLFPSGAEALTGAELAKMTDQELESHVDRVRVFARVTAEQKLRIVRAFKARGHVVAMTGDGVNDAPALREAHIGVAMGKSGTDVARQAADMVIADDNFATIVEAVREGRAIYRNIQKFIYFLLSSNAGLLVAVFVASFLPHIEPLTPLMILWINLVTNGLPALALGVDAPDPSQMHEPPRRANTGLLRKREYVGILYVGVFMGACGIACYLWPWETSPEVRAELGRSVAFSLLALSPLFHAFNCRSSRVSIFSLRPFVFLPLVLAVAVSAGIHLLAVLVPALRPIFRTLAMSPYEWTVLLLLSASIIPVVELSKIVIRPLSKEG